MTIDLTLAEFLELVYPDISNTIIDKCSLHSGVWIGWPGPEVLPGDRIPDPDPADQSPTGGLMSEKIAPVYLTDWEYENYYNGCCNATLWPLFHSMPERTLFHAAYWDAYRLVNMKFAFATLEVLRSQSQNQVFSWHLYGNAGNVSHI